jgi:maltooligosyltrehalose synthase
MLAALVLGAAGCFAQRYPRHAATHADLLAAMARKGADLVVAGQLTAESVPELTYPLERALAFTRHARQRTGAAAPASLAALEALAERYRTFIDTVDRIRREQRGDIARATLAAPLAAVEAAAQAVHSTLGDEGRRG